MTKLLIFILYFLGSIVFAVAGSSVGMGIGFLIRGDFSGFAIKSFVFGLLVVTSLYALHRFISGKMDQELYLFRKRGELVGILVFLGLFIYFAAFTNN